MFNYDADDNFVKRGKDELKAKAEAVVARNATIIGQARLWYIYVHIHMYAYTMYATATIT